MENMLQSDNKPIQILVTQQKGEMDIEEEIALVYLLTRRMRIRTEKRKPKNESVRRIFQKREEEGAFVLFYYFN